MKPWIAAVLLACSACGFGEQGRSQHLSDAELRANFAGHRPAFQRLLAMAQEDQRFFRVAHDWVGIPDLPNEDAARAMPPARWAEYRRLFREADLPEGMSRRVEVAGLVLFWSSAVGILGGSAKGYAHSTEELQPQVASLDDPVQLQFSRDLRGRVERRFVPLGDGWYLVYEVS
jgi:hypothetical protein